MDAIVVAGGFGTRVWPLTERHPKHLLPVAGVPFIVHQITKLAAAGVDHVVLATSYRAEAFEPVLGDGRRYGVDLSYVREPQPLGTGGALRNAAPHLRGAPDDPVLVLNGDALSGHDVRAQVERWSVQAADVSLHLVEVADPRAFGSVPTDENGRVLDFAEKSAHPATSQVNAGCYVFRRRLVDAIPAGRVVSVERETFPALLASGALVLGHLDSAYWLDVGTPAAVVLASRDLVTGVASSPAAPDPPVDRLVDVTARVEAAASVVLGSSIGPRAYVGPGAVVEGSILMADARVEDGARLVDTVVATGATVGAGAVLVATAVGDDAIVSAGADLRGARIGAGGSDRDLEPHAQRHAERP